MHFRGCDSSFRSVFWVNFPYCNSFSFLPFLLLILPFSAVYFPHDCRGNGAGIVFSTGKCSDSKALLGDAYIRRGEVRRKSTTAGKRMSEI